MDRRWIFVVMALAIVVPLYVPIGLPIAPSPMTKAAFAAIEDLHEGDRVFVSLDVDPAATAELEPYFRAALAQLERKHVKLAFATLTVQAPPIIERWLREYATTKDLVYLGFREGRQNVLLGMAADLPRVFDGKTAAGTPLPSIDWLRDVHSLADFKLLVLVSAGSPGARDYVQFVQHRYALRMVAATTAASTTELAPYYQSGQLLGLVAGMSGAAEYEQLAGMPGAASAGADVLDIAQLVVIAAIVLGNLLYFTRRRR